MGAGDVAGNGQAEAGAPRILVAGIVQPQEGAEDVLALVLGNAGAVIGPR